MTNKYTIGAFALSAFTLAFNQAVYAQEDQAGLEEVVVTGIRQSLQAATDLKRNESRIVDAIVAEDIGKLPDNNIAEALQRITGVSINTDFGVGTSVSIRGLPQNRIELNGRSTVGDSRDGVSLEDFPSSFLKTVEVVKSPTADMIEGALGGTVSMKTVRPLELQGLTAAASLDGEYADKTQHWAPIFNASVGTNWDLGDAGSFGVMAMLSYQDREIRQDEFFNRVRLYDEDAGGAGAQGEGNTESGRYAVREQNTVEQFVENRERTASSITLQWAPASEKGSFYLDLSTTERSGSQAGVSILDVGGSRVYDENTTQDSNGQLNNYSLSGAFVIPKSKSTFRETESQSHALGGEWNFTDSVLVSGEISFSDSKSSDPATEFNLRPISRDTYNDDGSATLHTTDVAFNQSGSKIPSIVYADTEVLSNPDNLAIRQFFHDEQDTTNEELAYRLDVEIAEAFGFGWLPSLKAGIRKTEMDYTYDSSRFRIDRLMDQAENPDGSLHIVWIDDFEAMFPGSFVDVDYNNSFNQTGLSGQNDLLNYRVYDPSKVDDAEAIFGMLQQAFDGTTKGDEMAGSFADNLQRQELSYKQIVEDTSALYVSADLDFDVVTAVVGGRYIETDIESSYFEDGVIVTDTHSYSDFLPSLNVTYNATDDTKVRFAAAKVMRRADYDKLSPAMVVNNSIYSGTSGSALLNPFRATQFDLSLEHYFGAGNIVSAAIYYKDVESFLSSSSYCRASTLTSGTNPTEWQNICLLDAVGVDNPDIELASLEDFGGDNAAGQQFITDQIAAGLTGVANARATNGENGKVQGIELGYQQVFDFLPDAWSGLGVAANYTYADSEQPNLNPLLQISKNTYNAQVFWEYEAFQVRLAYNFRDRFLDTEEETRVANVGARALNDSTNDETADSYDATAGNNYRDDRGQFDFSASWEINDNVTVVSNISNLFGAPSSYSTELGSKWKYTEADRRMSIGVRAKF